MRGGEVIDMDIIAHRSAVGRRIIGAENREILPPAERRVDEER